MMRERKGSIFTRNGQPYARLQFVDANGKKRDLWRKCESRKQAKEVLKKLLREVEDNGTKALDTARMTLDQLCDYFQTRYLNQAEYVDGRKISGVRSIKPVLTTLKALRGHFGKRLVRSITYGDLEDYKRLRLKTPTSKGHQRSIAAVNRELSKLRRILGIAVREGWLIKNPFQVGDPLICIADERKRERILSSEEEARLLSFCTGKRSHLRPIIIAAIDTGCRLGELRKMKWKDIDFEAGLITIQAFNTKTMRERQVSLTTRLRFELEALTREVEDLVFGFRDNVKKSFASARRQAGLDDVRFHDLRHTHGSRLDDLGFSLAKIGSQLGHSQVQTTLRYVNRDKAGIKQVAVALDAYNQQTGESCQVSAAVN